MATKRSESFTPSLFGEEPAPPPKARAGSGKRPDGAPLAPAEAGPSGAEGAGGAGLFARVALNRPLRQEFTYGVPRGLEAVVVPGVRAAVPFGKTRQIGVVVSTSTEPEARLTGRLRWIAKVLDPEPIVDEELLSLTAWMAAEYACSWGEALAAVLPAGLKRETGRRKVAKIHAADGVGQVELESLAESSGKQHRLLRTLLELRGPVELRDVLRRLNLSDAPAKTLVRKGFAVIERVDAEVDLLLGGASDGSGRQRHATLSAGQSAAVQAVGAAVAARTARTFLLQGVTGSGKTEVYLRSIEQVLDAGRGAIVLVPEISLTPQTVGWFRSRFGEVAVMHSKMTDAQRLDAWLRVSRGEMRVVVGARSALFAPVRNLGIVVVDEEHETSFKQGSTPRYHAREVAVQRAARANAVCILGSATPSLESWRRAREGTYQRLLLPDRVSGGKLPEVRIVDMRTEPSTESRIFSNTLMTWLRETVTRGEQAILFQNRRGFSPVLWCPGCRETVRCSQCAVGLTLHRRINRLVCHSCCDELPVPAACPTCTHPGLRLLGVGSEKVEAALRHLVPSARVRRMDSDTMVRREDYEEALDAFGRGEIDVLVGTQMIAKGLDFPRVTLVGIISADTSLQIPDFRAAERTFQLIAQVSGRAGRSRLPGRIVVQTDDPKNVAIALAARHDYEGFAHHEDEERRDLNYPPHGRVLRVLFEDEEEARVIQAADRFADALRTRLKVPPHRLLGPAFAPISMARGRYRRHFMLKLPRDGADFAEARELLFQLASETPRPRVTLDVDAVSVL